MLTLIHYRFNTSMSTLSCAYVDCDDAVHPPVASTHSLCVVQTEEISLQGKMCWSASCSPKTVSLTTASLSQPDLPSKVILQFGYEHALMSSMEYANRNSGWDTSCLHVCASTVCFVCGRHPRCCELASNLLFTWTGQENSAIFDVSGFGVHPFIAVMMLLL